MRMFIDYYQLADFEKDALQDIVDICRMFPITLKQIAKCAEALGIIALDGKLNIYQRILFDGMISSSEYETKGQMQWKKN